MTKPLRNDSDLDLTDRKASAVNNPDIRARAENPPDGSGDEVLVIGGGPAGLAAAWAISRCGLSVRILEGSDRVGASWANRYDSLKLNSGRVISSLPGMRIDRRFGRWVSRDDFLSYLDRYARWADVAIEYGAEVERIDWTDGRWLVRTAGQVSTAAAVVVATGLNSIPNIPGWAQQYFPGDLAHSDQYRNSTPYRGRDVLVVGSGSSAHDIALDLVKGGAGRVRMAQRTPPLLAPKELFGISSSIMSVLIKHGPRVNNRMIDALSLWLHRWCFPDANQLLGTPPAGLAAALHDRGHGLTVEVGLLDAVRRGDIEIVAAVHGIEDGDLVLGDGQCVRPEAVILATGYRTALEHLVGHLDVLGEDGRPRVHPPQTLPHAPNLYFLGFRLPAGQLPDLAIDARRLARRFRHEAVRPSRRPAQLPIAPPGTVRPRRYERAP
jgi:putative flavoprotein involved in K+ transport